VIVLLRLIKRYYDQIDQQLVEDMPLRIADERPPIVIIPIRDWDRLAEKALRYALRLSSEVVAVHLTRLEGPDAEEQASDLRRRWREDIAPPSGARGFARRASRRFLRLIAA
jgi:hypothetical protein